jgi:hypothetical protein
MHAKFESPHPWFAILAGRRTSRPAFRTIGEVQEFQRSKSVQGVIQPIWGINHDDLLSSEVAGYTLMGRTN